MFIYLTLTDGREMKYEFKFQSAFAANIVGKELLARYKNIVEYEVR